jgi:hypothetical protein
MAEIVADAVAVPVAADVDADAVEGPAAVVVDGIAADAAVRAGEGTKSSLRIHKTSAKATTKVVAF